MPHLAGLIANGVRGNLATIYPPLSLMPLDHHRYRQTPSRARHPGFHRVIRIPPVIPPFETTCLLFNTERIDNVGTEVAPCTRI